MPLISLANVAFAANGRDILHDITFTIGRDQILTIVGPNGAGKSTLLALILGHKSPTGGTITRAKWLKMGFVPQKFHPPADLPMTARRFLRDIPQAAESPWLSRLNIAHLLDTPLQTLSGGETQRLTSSCWTNRRRASTRSRSATITRLSATGNAAHAPPC